MTKPKSNAGRKALPPGTRRVRLACTVTPGTLAVFEGMAQPGSNVGRVLDELAEVVEVPTEGTP